MRPRHFIKPGIGDLDDLKVRMQEWSAVFQDQSTDSFWYPQIHNGWYYLNEQEHYLFSQEGYQDFSISAGVSTLPVSDLTLASRRGPILCDGVRFPFTRCTSNLAVFRAATPIVSGSNYLYIDVPGELYLVTGQNNKDFMSVPSSTMLVERTFYWWDEVNRRVWIARDPADPNRGEDLYITFLKDAPELLQEEILLVDTDGNIRSMLGRISWGFGYNPTIVLPSSGSIPVSYANNSTVVPSGILAPGTRVGLWYIVDGSFVVTPNPSGTVFTAYSDVTEAVTVRWEQGDKYLNSQSFPRNGLSYIQLNPLVDGVEDGFLTLQPPRNPAENFNQILLAVSPEKIYSDVHQSVRAVATALDRQGKPLPNVYITAWVSGDTSMTPLTVPGGYDHTDYAGRRHFIWQSSPGQVGTYTIYASGSDDQGSLILSSETFEIQSNPISTNVSLAPKVFLYLSPSQNADTTYTLFIYLSNQAGIPYPQQLTVTVTCEKGGLFPDVPLTTGSTNTGQISIDIDITSPLRVGTCRYRKPNSIDRIVAVSDGNIIAKFTSAPLIVR